MDKHGKHIVPRQAKPIFISKVWAIASFIQREFKSKRISTERNMFFQGSGVV